MVFAVAFRRGIASGTGGGIVDDHQDVFMSRADLGNGPTRSIPLRSKWHLDDGLAVSAGWGEASLGDVTLAGGAWTWQKSFTSASIPASGTGPESVGPCWPARDVPPWGVSLPTPARSPSSYGAPPSRNLSSPLSAARHSIAGPSEPQMREEDGAPAELIFRPGSEPGPNNASAGRPPVVSRQMSPSRHLLNTSRKRLGF